MIPVNPGDVVIESIGLINRIRHQCDGVLVSASAGYNLGINRESPDYYEVSMTGKYYELLNKHIELHGTFSTGITNASLSSQITYIGPELVKGAITGERWWKSFISLGIETGFIYINRNWFALEHSFFVYTGNAAEKYAALFRSKPLITTGSGLRLLIPMVPWLSVTFIYAHKGKNKHWFGIE